MKVTLVILSALVAVATSAPTPQQQEGYNYDQPAAYNFAYTVNANDPYNNPVQFGHNEERQGVRTQGTYYVLLPDTRTMTVEYYVDETGYHPTYTFQGTAQYPQDNTGYGNAGR